MFKQFCWGNESGQIDLQLIRKAVRTCLENESFPMLRNTAPRAPYGPRKGTPQKFKNEKHDRNWPPPGPGGGPGCEAPRERPTPYSQKSILWRLFTLFGSNPNPLRGFSQRLLNLRGFVRFGGVQTASSIRETHQFRWGLRPPPQWMGLPEGGGRLDPQN